MSASLILPLIEDLQRQQEFFLKLFLALADIRLCRQHPDRVQRVAGAPVVGLAPEDGEQDRRVDAELLLDRTQRRAVLVEQLATVGGEAGDGPLLEVVCRRLHELGLPPLRPFRPAGQDQVGER